MSVVKELTAANTTQDWVYTVINDIVCADWRQ